MALELLAEFLQTRITAIRGLLEISVQPFFNGLQQTKRRKANAMTKNSPKEDCRKKYSQ
jgi:hypothetical protein